ncbi:MAG: hypothetical protein KF774_08600 [Planctomyces sp.]|nr:hypothetical protein [Planctomyces sp.]
MFRGAWTLLMRSMRLDARSPRAHAFRVISIGIVFWLLLAAHVRTGGVGAPGLQFFSLICMLCVGLITVAGAGLFASAITEEKEAGTLGLLLLADVRPMAVLVGKSTTRLVSALLTFAGILPFSLLALALGGVTAYQVWCGWLSLAAYLVLVANLAVLWSVTCRTTGLAASLTTLSLLSLLTAPLAATQLNTVLLGANWIPAGGWASSQISSVGEIADSLSPLTQLSKISETGFEDSPWSRQVLGSLAIGAALFCVAWIVFPMFCEYLAEGGPSRSLVARFRAGSKRRRFRLGMGRPRWFPLIWKDFQFLTGGLRGLALRTAAIPATGFLLYQCDELFYIGFQWSFLDMLRLTIILFAVIEAVSIASKIFRTEYLYGTLCTLALLPRSTLSLCYGKLAGCLLAFLPAVFWIVVVESLSPRRLWSEADVWWAWNSWIATVCAVCILCHLTAALSLTMKWGALPLAISILLVAGGCVSPFVAAATAFASAATGEDNPQAIPVLYLTTMICTSLQAAIGIRFRMAAAE